MMICGGGGGGGGASSSNRATAITPTLRALPFLPAYEPSTDEKRNVATWSDDVRKPSISRSPCGGTM
jgi:hypothetical protein